MPQNVTKECLLLIINIGISRPNAEVNPSFLEKAKEVAKRKIEKMIFFKPKDEVAILLMGSSITRNSLNSEHVEEFADFQFANWDLIQKVLAFENTKHCVNWVEALQAGIEFMKRDIINTCIRKVILMSDFKEEAEIISKFNVDVIARELSDEGIDLIAIAEESLDEKAAGSLKISEMFLKNLLQKINGHQISFDDALAGLKFYVGTPVKPFPLYLTLELVDKKIPIVSFIKTHEQKFATWQTAKGDQKVQSKTQYVDRQRNTYEKDEIVTGYKYGETFIPVEKELEEAMSYKSGTKSYKIYGFTDRNNINLEYLYESNTHIILPSSAANIVAKPFYSLVQAMHNTNSVAIVRKVLRTNCVPRMVALFPCIDIPDEPWCLVEIALSYAEERKLMETRPMKSVIKQLTSEQNEAVDSLIDSLLLPDTQDSYEVDGVQYFLPGYVPDPAAQHKWHLLSYRAINPDKPLPPMENYLNEILNAPLIKEKSKLNLQKIAKLFQLENVDPKTTTSSEMQVEDTMHVEDDINLKASHKTEDESNAENAPYKESVLSLDISDIDLDELAANI